MYYYGNTYCVVILQVYLPGLSDPAAKATTLLTSKADPSLARIFDRSRLNQHHQFWAILVVDPEKSLVEPPRPGFLQLFLPHCPCNTIDLPPPSNLNTSSPLKPTTVLKYIEYCALVYGSLVLAGRMSSSYVLPILGRQSTYRRDPTRTERST